MKYELSIIELTPLTEEEARNRSDRFRDTSQFEKSVYASKPYNHRRVLLAEVSKEEFEAVKKAIIGSL